VIVETERFADKQSTRIEDGLIHRIHRRQQTHQCACLRMTLCVRTVKSEQDAKVFQEDLGKLIIWEQTWMMSFIPTSAKSSASPARRVWMLKAIIVIIIVRQIRLWVKCRR